MASVFARGNLVRPRTQQFGLDEEFQCRAHARAAVSGVKFDAGPFQKPADCARFVFSLRRKRSGCVVNSVEGVCVAQKIELHASTKWNFLLVAPATGIVSLSHRLLPGPE